MSNKVLSQDEIDELLQVIESCEKDTKPEERTRKVKIFDFKRPDIIGKSTIRILSNILEEYCVSITKYFVNDLEIPVKAHVASVDQLTREEFIRCIPTPTFSFSTVWLDGVLLFNVNPATFLEGFLGRKAKKMKKGQKARFLWRNPSAFEKKIFSDFVANPCLKRLEQAFSNRSNRPLPSMSEIKFEDNPVFLPYGENYCEMGTMASIELSFEGTGKNKKDDFYPIDIFFNAQILENLSERNIIYHGEKNKVVELEKPRENFLVELGRCRLSDELNLEKNMILELNSLAGNPLKIFIDGTECWTCEALCLDDSKAVRINEMSDGQFEFSDDEKNTDDFYNTRVILGWTNVSKKEADGFGEGSIIELEQKWYEQVFVYKNNRLIAKGDVMILDENFAVKIKDLC